MGQAYTFVALTADGRSPFLDVRMLDNPGALVTHARELLEEHRSCSRVEVWDGSIRLMVVGRDTVDHDEDAPA